MFVFPLISDELPFTPFSVIIRHYNNTNNTLLHFQFPYIKIKPTIVNKREKNEGTNV